MAKSRQLRITAAVTEKEKKQVDRLVRDIPNVNSVSDLIRQLLDHRYRVYLDHRARLKAAWAAHKADKLVPAKSSKRTNLVRGASHRARKPARVRSAGNTATNSAKRRPAKRAAQQALVAVSPDDTGGRARASAKKR